MIYFPDRNLVIATPPKCGSTSMHAAFCPPAQYVIGPQPGGDIDKHTFHLPWECTRGRRQTHRNFPKIAVMVRNPYHRAVSFWSHARKRELPDIAFDDFLRDHLLSGHPWFSPVSQLIQEAGFARYRYWQLEHIRAPLEKHGLGAGSLPHLNQRAVSAELTAERMELLREWAAPDCQAFAYSAPAV